MGICISSEERAEKNHSQLIDRMIKEDSRKLKRECKILLLGQLTNHLFIYERFIDDLNYTGSGESGKTTIVKQMKIIHQNGYTNEELYTWRATVYKNLLESAQALVAAINKFEYQFDDKQNNYYAQQIADYQLGDTTNPILTEEIASAVTSVWKDGVVARLLDKESSGFYLMDSASYFFENVDRLAKRDYIPSVQDVLRARSKTTGIMETRFTIDQLSIHMFDVGGQRSERKKWIHCFEAVTSIIFCVSLSEYDQVLLEESRQNRMMESLVLFESVINSRWFLRTSIILFLNKVDVFKEKLAKVPLERYFPAYAGNEPN
ncbi:Guanine nucleotide-binding protein alpha-2 subunit [Apophysomyces ossiformis]|uniref:Guanine nucleotide-binding protein alpha-2 subunit n=1 Tax=Apophysomyces ossiformis TaxID=679940 RepID=A0A8H7EU63_9FUNG|nr:Guanine nucleotide-binding protein alpha-2 subunit [Apophysomyces ossiformis]